VGERLSDAKMVLASTYEGDINAKDRVISQRKTDLAEPMYVPADLSEARAENEAFLEAVEVLRAATDFQPRPEFELDSALGSASNQYLRALARVREELVPRANRSNLQVDSQLGMPRLSPTRDAEIERYLEALDVIETVVGLAVDARVQRIDKIQIRLDPGLNSREGLGAIERTRVTFTLTGRSLALERVLSWTQRPRTGGVLHIDDVEMVPARSRENEVRLDLTIVIARLTEPIEEGV
jgi:hypothetical protein